MAQLKDTLVSGKLQSTGNFEPVTDNTSNIGTSDLRFSNGYVNSLVCNSLKNEMTSVSDSQLRISTKLPVYDPTASGTYTTEIEFLTDWGSVNASSSTQVSHWTCGFVLRSEGIGPPKSVIEPRSWNVASDGSETSASYACSIGSPTKKFSYIYGSYLGDTSYPFESVCTKKLYVTSSSYGSTVPTSGVAGQLFFQIYS